MNKDILFNLFNLFNYVAFHKFHFLFKNEVVDLGVWFEYILQNLFFFQISIILFLHVTILQMTYEKIL